MASTPTRKNRAGGVPALVIVVVVEFVGATTLVFTVCQVVKLVVA